MVVPLGCWGASPGSVWVRSLRLRPGSPRASGTLRAVPGASRCEVSPPPPPSPKLRRQAPRIRGLTSLSSLILGVSLQLFWRELGPLSGETRAGQEGVSWSREMLCPLSLQEGEGCSGGCWGLSWAGGGQPVPCEGPRTQAGGRVGPGPRPGPRQVPPRQLVPLQLPPHPYPHPLTIQALALPPGLSGFGSLNV